MDHHVPSNEAHNPYQAPVATLMPSGGETCTCLTDRERAIIEKWRRQYRQRWIALGLLSTQAVVAAAVATTILREVVRSLGDRGVPLLDALTLNWFEYLGEPATSRLLLTLAIAVMMSLTSAGTVGCLIAIFRNGFRRYHVMEKLLRAASVAQAHRDA